MATPSVIDEQERLERTVPFELVMNSMNYSQQRDYVGWDYSDGLSSKLRQTIPIDNQWLNLAFQEGIKRAPVNIRPYMLVEQRRNAKGTALFVLANLHAYELTGEKRYAADARWLADWLVENSIDGYSGFCVGYAHDLQGLEKKIPVGTPGVVGTTYATLALLRVGDVLDESYRDVAESAADFLFEDLDYTERGDEARIKYKPTDSGEFYTINANALGARLLIELYAETGTERYREAATKILNYVASCQTELGGWKYRDPPSASHLSMDNHHNGFIVEALQRYRAITGSDRFDDVLADAIAFYRNTLFEDSGAPNWDENDAYPKDIHAVAQGILVFTRAGDYSFARRIIGWARNHLYAGNGQFYYRKHRLFTRRYTLMRWCQAWMCYALGEYCRGAIVPADAPFLSAGSSGETDVPTGSGRDRSESIVRQ